MIQRLLVTHLRILLQIELTQLKPCNVFIGNNGSGKTSLLEAIFLLSRGKSFRHHQPKHYICHDKAETTVFASFTDGQSMAVAKTRNGDSKLRLNGSNILTQSELTRQLPVILLDPTQLDVLDHGSNERRSLLDWLVFHNESTFYKTWLSYQRSLKQRNRLLREHSLNAQQQLAPTIAMQLTAWDEQIANLGEQIHAMRCNIVKAWQPIFADVCQQFLPQYEDIQLRYSSGFDATEGLFKVLQARQSKDVDLGYTRVGVHRADMLIFVGKGANKKNAVDVFSRGEKKLLIMALKLSQLALLATSGITAVVLLDDITAELDTKALKRLLTGLHACQSQLFITSLTTHLMPMVQQLWQDYQQFDIKDGQVYHVT